MKALSEKILPENSHMKMKEIMNDITRQQVGRITPGQHRWAEHVVNCIAAEICPACGNDLYFDGKVVDKDLKTTSFPVCPICNWEDYAFPTLTIPKAQHYDSSACSLRPTSSKILEKTNRHGLV